MIEKLKESYNKLRNKEFTFYFFVVDSANIPNGSMFYSYVMAKEIQDLGYNVKMLYQYEGEDKSIPERSFIGVGEWLGKEYSEGLEHINMNATEIKFTNLDYILIPMAMPSLTLALREYNVPSKVIMLCNNPVLPLSTYDIGANYHMYGFNEVWCASEECVTVLKSLVSSQTGIRVVKPSKGVTDIDITLSKKPLSVGVYTINERDMRELYNTFITLYPEYNFITFTPTRMYSYEKYEEIVRSTPILVWIDDSSVNGQTLREFMSSTNIILAKRNGFISENTDCFSHRLMVWTDSIYEIAVKLGSVVKGFLNGEEDNVGKSIKESSTIEDSNDCSVKTIVNQIIDSAILKLDTKINLG